MMHYNVTGFRIAARGLVIENDQLLFVSNDGEYWYLPGGRLEGTESLTDCVEREVYEETGLVVKTGSLVHVLESFDLNDGLHKINFYFRTTLIQGEVSDTWCDEDNGIVQFRRYFSLADIKQHKTILPRFLASGEWCREYPEAHRVYQGFVTMRGFEMVDEVSMETTV